MDFSHGIELIFKALIGHYNLYNFLIQNNVRISKEREKEWIKD